MIKTKYLIETTPLIKTHRKHFSKFKLSCLHERLNQHKKLKISLFCNQVIFVGTEVSPWSKVGGLGDVLEGLPASLASRGHRVMTVVPRYQEYEDTYDTGHVIPIELPEKYVMRRRRRRRRGDEMFAKVYLCVKKGVERVFVDHCLFKKKNVSKNKPSTFIYPYAHNVDESEYDVQYSILCQVALSVPVLLWNQESIQSHVNLDLIKEIKSIKTNYEHSTNVIVDKMEERYINDNLLYDDGFIFVGNDWPCGLLPIWLNKYISMTNNDICASLESTNNNVNVLCENMHGVDCDSEFSNKIKKPDLKRFQLALSNALKNSKTAFVIHNMAYEGKKLKNSLIKLKLWNSKLSKTFFDEEYDGGEIKESFSDIYNTNRNISKGNDINWLDAGLLLSDTVITVSPNYAKLIKSSAKTQKEMTILSKLELKGIMNGIDITVWNPKNDPYLSKECRYDIDTIDIGKSKSKLKLQKQLKLNVDINKILFGFIGRLDEQKGVDILLNALLKIYKPQATKPSNQDIYNEEERITSIIYPQFVLLGCGNHLLEQSLKCIEFWFPGHAIGIVEHNEELAHQIMASSDYLIVPSRFEPCGLVALCALQYGTIPLVSPVGGLIDLLEKNKNIGIKMKKIPKDVTSLDESSEDLKERILEAMKLKQNEEFEKMRRQCMETDVSWQKPAENWERLLSDLRTNIY